MRVFQLSEDRQKLVFKCPRCNATVEKSLEELEEEARQEEENVAESALDNATSS